MKLRQGFTLVELMVAMGLTTVLFGAAIGMVHRAMHVHSDAMREDRLQHQARLLSRQLRSDARRATTADIGDGSIALILPGGAGDATVTYKTRSDLIIRELNAANEQTHRETFRLADCLPTDVRLLENPQRVALEVRQPRRGSRAPLRTVLQVEAVVGSRAMIGKPTEAPAP